MPQERAMERVSWETEDGSLASHASAPRTPAALAAPSPSHYPRSVRPSALAAGVYFGRPEERRVVGSLELCRTSYVPGQRIPEHVHDAAYLCLALSGSFRE